MYVMTVTEFIEKLKKTEKLKTLYVMGCFGAPLKPDNIQRYINQYNYNHRADRQDVIRRCAKARTVHFGFDCVCLIKAILWGFTGDKKDPFGGARYQSNGVPDIGADNMITKCNHRSRHFKNIIPGAAVWLPGHIGVYIGDDNVIECSPAWEDGVQVTKLNQRNWIEWGLLPWIDYNIKENPERKTDREIAKEIIRGEWGNGETRKKLLRGAGYTDKEITRIQNLVNQMLK